MFNKKIKNVIAVSFITLILLGIYAIAIANFFTKENLLKNTSEKSSIACKYKARILQEKKIEMVIGETKVVNKIQIVSDQRQTQEKNSTKQMQNKASQREANTNQIQKENSIEQTQNKASQKEGNTNQIQKENSIRQTKNEASKKVESTKVPQIAVATAKTQDIQVKVETQYKGYSAIGKIEIPKTKVNLPILSKVTAGGMEVAPCLLYGTGELNKNGSNLIVGHNYNKIFTKNKNLQIGDKIYVTTIDGKRIEYVIYEKFLSEPESLSFIKKDTGGKPEIALSTCTSNDDYRLVILARSSE